MEFIAHYKNVPIDNPVCFNFGNVVLSLSFSCLRCYKIVETATKVLFFMP